MRWLKTVLIGCVVVGMAVGGHAGPAAGAGQAGARVEAYIGTTRCAVATTRRIGNFTGFSIDIVGPDSIPGCTVAATITFRVDGRNTNETAVNQSGQGASLDLSLS